MDAEQAAEQDLYTVLAADVALAALVGTRICRGIAPAGTAYPLVVYSAGDGSAVPGGDGSDGVGALYKVPVTVRAVGEVSLNDLAAITARFDALLGGRRSTVGSVNLRWERVGSLRYPEQVEGRSGPALIYHAGRQYRVTAS